MTYRIEEVQTALNTASHLISMQADVLKEAVHTLHLLLSDSPDAKTHAKENLREWASRGLIQTQDALDVQDVIKQVLSSDTPQMGYNEVTWHSTSFMAMRHTLFVLVGMPENKHKVESAARKRTLRGWFVGQLTLAVNTYGRQWKQRDMIGLVESSFNHGARQCGL